MKLWDFDILIRTVFRTLHKFKNGLWINGKNKNLQVVNAELPLREVTKAELKTIELLEVGDIVHFKIKKLLNDGTIRIVIPVISIQT